MSDGESEIDFNEPLEDPSMKPSLEEGKRAIKGKYCVICKCPTDGIYATCRAVECGNLWVWGR